MRLTGQSSFNGGIVSPEVYARDEYQQKNVAVSDAVNMEVRVQGSIQNRAGTEIVGGFDNSNGAIAPYLIPFQFTNNDSYVLEFANSAMRVIKNGAYVLDDNGTFEIGLASLSVAAPAVLTASGAVAGILSVGNLAYIRDPNGTSELNATVVKVTAVSGTDISFVVVGGDTVDNSAGAWGVLGAGAKINRIYEVACAFTAGVDMRLVQYVQDVDTVFFAGFDYLKMLVRVGDTNWTFSNVLTDPKIGHVTSVTATAHAGTGTANNVAFFYTVTAISASGEESYGNISYATVSNDLALVGAYNQIDWPAVPGATSYRVYKVQVTGVYGFIGETTTNSFGDRNIIPDTTVTFPVQNDPFPTTGDQPTVLSFVEQRLAAAATPNNPQAIYLSTSTEPQNFSQSVYPRDDEAIRLRMRAQHLDQIVAIVPLDPPQVFTKSAEFLMRGGDNKGYLAPGNVIIRPVSFRGSAAYPPPLLIGNSVLHVRPDGKTIYEAVPQRDPRNINILCDHLFAQSQITSWAYAQAPNSLVWVTLDDGSLLSMAYDVAEKVWGWTRHVLGGTDVKVLQVCVVRDGAIDYPYVVVQRTLYGKTVRLIERFRPRYFATVQDAYFVDCGFSYSGAATTQLRGLVHLRGQTVSVLADGAVVENAVISPQGVLTLPHAASKIQVGFPYTSYFKTVPIMNGSYYRIGNVSALLKANGKIFLTVENTRGLKAARDGFTLEEVKQFTGEVPIALDTGNYEIVGDNNPNSDMIFVIQQDYPLPMTVSKLVPDTELSEDG